jgi:hypothetical protein
MICLIARFDAASETFDEARLAPVDDVKCVRSVKKR